MPHATLNGLKINYVAQGNGPPLIMSGDDASHSTSSAHALRELVPGSALSPAHAATAKRGNGHRMDP